MNVCKILLIFRHIGQSRITIDQNKTLPNLTNYLRQLSKTEEENRFFLPWGGLCLCLFPLHTLPGCSLLWWGLGQPLDN